MKFIKMDNFWGIDEDGSGGVNASKLTRVLVQAKLVQITPAAAEKLTKKSKRTATSTTPSPDKLEASSSSLVDTAREMFSAGEQAVRALTSALQVHQPSPKEDDWKTRAFLSAAILKQMYDDPMALPELKPHVWASVSVEDDRKPQFIIKASPENSPLIVQNPDDESTLTAAVESDTNRMHGFIPGADVLNPASALSILSPNMAARFGLQAPLKLLH